MPLSVGCAGRRTTAPPGVLELMVAQRWLCLCLRCTGNGLCCLSVAKSISVAKSRLLARTVLLRRMHMCVPVLASSHLCQVRNLADTCRTRTVETIPRTRVMSLHCSSLSAPCAGTVPAGADSRHKSLALWEKLLARQAGAVRAIRARATATAKAGDSGAQADKVHDCAQPLAHSCISPGRCCCV
jgi:hypothetical protein